MKKVFCFLIVLLTLSSIQMRAQFLRESKDYSHESGLFYSEKYDGNEPNKHGGGSGSGQGGEVPIGSGLLVLTGLSLGYACFKRNRKED